jgi:AhpD family alkylhydroperoxidase
VVAVSVANNCNDCIHSHTAAAFAKGMTEAQYGELLAVVGMATAMQAPVDPKFLVGAPR